MCLAIPGKIIELNECTAKVEFLGIEKEINIQLLDAPTLGDYVLVHAGCAIQIISKDYENFLEETYAKLLEESR